jgi:hypothetical protein
MIGVAKASIPKPKYAVGEHVIFHKPSEGNNPPSRDVGKVESIEIKLSKSGSSVRYQFENKEEDGSYDESSISRRVVLG